METIEYKNHTIEIIHDQHPENPLEDWDLTGNIAYCSTRYVLGDKLLDPKEIEAIEKSKDYISVPVFAYIHSGIVLKTGETNPFHCDWDSGQSGIVYISKEEARKEYGWKKISPQRKEQIKQYLRHTVEVFSNYVSGNVYGYRIKNSNDEELDSCWGFFGDPDEEHGIISEAKSIVDHYIENEKEVA